MTDYTFQHRVFSCSAPWALFAPETADIEPLLLWRGRDDDDVWIAAGAIALFEKLDEARAALSRALSSDIAPRAFCVTAFNPEIQPGGIWSDFSAGLCFLPRVLVKWQNGEAQALVQDSPLAEKIFLRLRRTLENPVSESPLPTVRFSESSLSREKWDAAVRRIQDEIRGGHLQKAVLARALSLEFSDRISSALLLKKLADQNERSFLFAVRGGESVFLGASPEMLFRTDGKLLISDCLAGTRARGIDAEDDERLEHELLGSQKDLTEHNIVREFLYEHFRNWCEPVTADFAPRILKQAAVQHLHTTVHGVLKRDISPDHILSSLHPTPAVCGVPRDIAREIISKLELVPRGLYTGAVGWIDRANAEFAVAIRSALIKDNTIHAFAGAGITAHSDPQSEWNETEHKLTLMRRALGLTVS